jgi:uncharacterized protein (TIGR02246 family)
MTRPMAWVAGVTLLTSLMAGGALQGQAPSDGEVRRLTEAYAQAWAKGDAKAITALHTGEALRIGLDGKVTVGRAAIEQAFSAAFASAYRGSKIGLTPGQTARAAQDVYVAEGTFQIAGGMPPPGSPTRGRYLNTLVRTNGRWLIAGNAFLPPLAPAKPPPAASK